MASSSMFHCAMARIPAHASAMAPRPPLIRSRGMFTLGSRCATRRGSTSTLATSQWRCNIRQPTSPCANGFHSLLIRPRQAYSGIASRNALYMSRTSWISIRHVSTSSGSNKDGIQHDDEKSSVTAKDTFKKKAMILHENIYTLPNMLTMTRLVSAPVIGYWVMQGKYKEACVLFGVACVTDALDGWIARRFNMQSIVGTIIDPMADKTLMTILTVTLAMRDLIPVPIAGIILGRDLGLVLASFYYRYISLPEPKTFARYWDFSIPSAEVRPTTISKVNTAIQMAYIGLSLVAPVFDLSGHLGLEYLGYTCALTTIWSGASYVYSKDAVKILYPKK